MLICGDFATPGGDRHDIRHKCFPAELVPLLAAQRKFILRLTGNVIALGKVFGGDPHSGVTDLFGRQASTQKLRGHGAVGLWRASQEIGLVGHALSTTGEGCVCTEPNCIGSQRHRINTRPALAVDSQPRVFDPNSGLQCGNSGGISGGRQRASHDDVVELDGFDIETGTFNGTGNRDTAELMCLKFGQ